MYSRTPFACIGDFRPIDSVQQLESPAMLSLLRVKPDQRSANPQTAYARRAADDPDTAKQKLAAEARLNATKERIFIVSKALIMLFLFFILMMGVESLILSSSFSQGRRIETRLRMAFLRKIPRLDSHYFYSRPVADLVQRAFSLEEIHELPPLLVHMMKVLP